MKKIKEIGGYFELEHFSHNEYYKELIALNTGRNALIYIMKAKNIKKLYIPHYLCNSICHILKKNGFDFSYYNIDLYFKPQFDKTLKEGEYLYIVNYYGQLSNECIGDIWEHFHNIILDNTHAFFQKPLKGLDTIYSCRKFFGVPDGAYLSTEEILKENLQVDLSMHRFMHLLGRYEEEASEFYKLFKKNDESFKDEPLKYMSKLTHNILSSIDYEKVKNVRTENFTYLHNNLIRFNQLKLIIPEGPYSYPFYVKNGIEVRKKMAQKRIYIPCLWPNVLDETSPDSIEYHLSANILPLPCDQRYTIDDMNYMINELTEVITF